MEKTLKKGFTLTELIVVIVIIGILASVLIPSLTGYIDKSKDAAAKEEASSFVTAHQAWVGEKEVLEGDTKTDFYKYCVSLGIIEEGKEEILKVNTDWNTGFIFTSTNNKRTITYTVGNPELVVEKN